MPNVVVDDASGRLLLAIEDFGKRPSGYNSRDLFDAIDGYIDSKLAAK